jgi:hypothetical protein
MGTFVHRDLISEKLEIARTLGLVTRYFVRPGAPVDGGTVSVRVWRSSETSEPALREYLVRLLDGLVSDQQIAVTGEGEVPARPEAVEGTRIATVPAAA